MAAGSRVVAVEMGQEDGFRRYYEEKADKTHVGKTALITMTIGAVFHTLRFYRSSNLDFKT